MKYISLLLVVALLLCGTIIADRLCPAGTRLQPKPRTTWHIQYVTPNGLNLSVPVQLYDVDLFDTQQSVIDTLHGKGIIVICYFSTQYENWRPDASEFNRTGVLGNDLDGWEGERWVNISSPVVRNIMKNRLDLAVTKTCDGVDPDNVDGYTNTNGLGLTAAQQMNFNQFMAIEAHSRNLSIGLKNDLNQIPTLVSYYDFSINEQCLQYSECDTLFPFVQNNKPVFTIEYKDQPSSFCPQVNSYNFSTLRKNMNLDSWYVACCSFDSRGCSGPSYECLGTATTGSSTTTTTKTATSTTGSSTTKAATTTTTGAAATTTTTGATTTITTSTSGASTTNTPAPTTTTSANTPSSGAFICMPFFFVASSLLATLLI